MARPRGGPAAPRDHSPDIPPTLDERAGLSAREQVEGARLALAGGEVDAAHSRITESRLTAASLARLDLTGATLVDVSVAQLRAVECLARESRWRNVVVDGGRIGTLDALRAEWNGVTLRGLRIDYIGLASAELSDILIAECVIGTLDLPEATLSRVRFENSRADEVDTRGMRAKDLDLRGLDVASFTDVRALAGVTIEAAQAEFHAAAFARALGIDARE